MSISDYENIGNLTSELERASESYGLKRSSEVSEVSLDVIFMRALHEIAETVRDAEDGNEVLLDISTILSNVVEELRALDGLGP